MILVMDGRSTIGSALIESLVSNRRRVRGELHRNAIDAAKDADVQLLVRSSILGADRDSPAEFVNAHTICDRYLEQSGLDNVIVRPNLFFQNVPESTIPAIDEGGNFYLDAGDARISMVDTRDVVAVIAPSPKPSRLDCLADRRSDRR